MSRKFCPKCGKTETKNNPILTELCKKCFTEETPLLLDFKLPKKITICKSCNSYLHKNAWKKSLSNTQSKNISEIIKKVLEEKIKVNPELKSKKIKVTPKFPPSLNKSKKIQTTVNIKGKIKNTEIEEEYEFPIPIEFNICNNCKKVNSNYYEAILQIRPKNEELIKQAKTLLVQQKNTFITKEVETKHGLDLYTTSTPSTIKVATQLRKEFNLEIKKTKTLYGEKDSKRLYRTTILLRLQ